MTYGAISNAYFRFSDKTLGESTTACGRHIVTHQHRKVNELLDDSYDEFGEAIIYGDSVAGDTMITTDQGDIKIEDLFVSVDVNEKGKEYCNRGDIKSLTFDEDSYSNQYKDIKYVVRHAVDKQMYRVWFDDNTRYIDITEDHSLIGLSPLNNKSLIEVKPTDIINREHRHILHVKNKSFIPKVPTNIEKIKSPEYVYDIEVADTHKFYGNDILLHNTDSSYFHTFTDNANEAKKVGDAIADEVNKSFIPFMMNNFLVDKENAEIIRCGREIVADRGIFVKKKKYMLHLVDLDGYKVDKSKIMGLDSKRATIPKPIAKNIENFIERLLKGESWEDIEQDVVDYKDILLNSNDILDIGIPSGVNKIEEYTKNYDIDPTTYLPGTVGPCIHYNLMRAEYNDLLSPELSSGMKTRKFFLKKANGRFKTISLPFDMKNFDIPEWFWEFEIDKNLHMEKLVDAPINNVIKAIGEEAPTKQSMKIKSLFEF